MQNCTHQENKKFIPPRKGVHVVAKPAETGRVCTGKSRMLLRRGFAKPTSLPEPSYELEPFATHAGLNTLFKSLQNLLKLVG